MSLKNVFLIGLTSKCRKQRCTRCDFPLEHSIWKGKRIVYNLFNSGSQVICVKCIQKTTGIRTHTPEDLDNFVFKGIQKSNDVIDKISKTGIKNKNRRLGQKCSNNNHDKCKNSGNFCSCYCHEVSN